MGDFQEDNFEQKLLLLKDTQESIQSLSLWCLKHHHQHKKVVGCWLHVLKKVKVEQRVTLFYLANDVIQYSKRKNYPFVESWATALQKATPLVRDDKVKHKILRLFKIWDERNVYDETFLADLSGLLTAHTKKSNQLSTAELIQEFQPSLLFSKIRKCKVLEEDTDLKLKIVKECNIPVSDPDALQIAVKDRRNGDDLLQDIDDGILKLEAYTKALELEINERIEVINVLEVSEQFYDTQRGEAKVVCNAYRNFGNRIKTLKRKLDELLPTLQSPVPSPDINAPSPSSGSDLDIPEETTKTTVECYDSEKSFIGTDFVTAMNNVHEKQAQFIMNMSQTYQHQEMTNLAYNIQTQNDYDDYLHGKEMSVTAAPGYYKNNSQVELESPVSPIVERHFTDSYSFQSEGNPIEVINSSNNESHNFGGGGGVSSFLQNLMSSNTTTPMPVPPTQSKIPGLESPTDNAREVFSFMESKMKVDDSAPMPWEDKPLTKYQSWPSPDLTWNHSQETPVSPPAFEQESYGNPVEYIDTNVVVDNGIRSSYVNVAPHLDVDHRMLSAKQVNDLGGYEPVSTIPLPKHDVDDRISLQGIVVPNRNLISLTESPSSISDTWKMNDADYRGIPMPPTPPAPLAVERVGGGRALKPPLDNIESVDMEMSDDEGDSKHEDRPKHRKTSFKEEEPPLKKANHQSQLLPPPSPWGMMNMNEESGEATPKGSCVGEDELHFNKSMPPAFMTKPPPAPGIGIEQLPRPPMSDFSCFPMPPRPPPGGMRFPHAPPMLRLPPHGDPSMFQPPPDFQHPPPNRMLRSGPGFGPPFGFMFPPNMGRSQTPRKEFVRDDDVPSRGPPYQQQSPTTPQGDRFLPRTNSINSIEPIIKTRQFDKRLSDSGSEFEGPLSDFTTSTPVKTVRSNLKEISLSAVLEQCIARSIEEEKEKEKNKKTSPGDNDNDNNNNSNDNGNEDVVNDTTAEAPAPSSAPASSPSPALAPAADDPPGDRNDDADDDEQGKPSSTLNDVDLFGVDGGGTSHENHGAGGGGDDGDDLYNNIEETTDYEESITKYGPDGDSFMGDRPPPTKQPSEEHQSSPVVYDSNSEYPRNNVTPPNLHENNKQRPKAPFQGVVPKLTKPWIAPPVFMEEDERAPWPMLPVIDLSDENNSPREFPPNEQSSIDERDFGGDHDRGLSFLRSNGFGSGDARPRFNMRGGSGSNDFRPHLFNSPGGDRRFPNPMQGSPMRMRGDPSNRSRGGGRFSSPRQDFRPRGGGQSSGGGGFTPNQNQMPRMTRPNFPRPPSGVGVANARGGGNFQNASRMFRGRSPGRPFRRGW